MGGKSTTSSTGTGQTVSQPWKPAQPALQGILGQIGGMTGNASLTPAEQSSIGGLINSSGYINQFLPGTTNLTNTLLSGGGANNQAPLINDAYQKYSTSLLPFTNPAFLDPRNTPGFGDALSALNSDISNQVNGMFAGAGRDLSGQNLQTLARGLSQGEGGLIANQYNANVGNYLGAAGAGYNAGNTTGGLLSSLNQQGLANQQAGLGTAQTGAQFAADPFTQQLMAEAEARGIPLSYLSGLTSIAQPIAGLGGQTNTNTSQTGTQNLSPVAQFAALAGGLGSLFGKKAA